MRYVILFFISIILISGCIQSDKGVEGSQLPGNMRLTSSAFENNGMIPPFYTCDEGSISPPLTIEGVPENAKSLVLIMDDPDALKPAGKVWDHWVAWNIPPGTKEIEEGVDPPGIMGKNSRNNLTYSGPCPPDGEHKYIFKLYAIDDILEIPPGSTKSEVLEAIKGHVIEEAELVGKYKRV